MKAYHYLLGGLAIVAMACSSGVQVSSNHEDVDFSEYATYKMLPIDYEAGDRTAYSEENKQILKDAIAKQMDAMNFKSVSSNPDVLMHADVVIYKEAQKRERTLQDGAYYMGQRNYSWSASDSILVGYYDEGSLIINMIDAEKNELVWHSTARKALKDKPSDDREEKIRQAVADMFAEYPGNAATSARMNEDHLKKDTK